MNQSDESLPIGSFVRVRQSIGVVVGLPDANSVPEEHYAIWFGQLDESNLPQCRTVPMEYCVFVPDVQYFHKSISSCNDRVRFVKILANPCGPI